MTEIVDNIVEAIEAENTLKNRYLTFSIGNEVYGIALEYVIEIVGIQPITAIPGLPEYVKGVMNLRGKIIPVMDVRLRLKKEPRDYNDRTCVIVIDLNSTSIGLIVDAVSEVITIPEQDVIESPKLNKSVDNKFVNRIAKVGNDVKLLIDCKRLLSEDELMEINEAL